MSDKTTAKPVRMLISRERLAEKIAAEPNMDVEAGLPQKTTSYATGSFDGAPSPRLRGAFTCLIHGASGDNPFPPETFDWMEWRAGFEEGKTLEWSEIEVPEELAALQKGYVKP